MSKSVVNLHAVAQQPLPVNSTSPSDWAKAFDQTLAQLDAEGYEVFQVFPRPYGRSNYFFALCGQKQKPAQRKAKSQSTGNKE